jgi:hypothetical protein
VPTRPTTRRRSSPACARLGQHRVSTNINAQRGSNIDLRTTRHECMAVVEQTRHRGLARLGWTFQFKGAAYILIRLPKLILTG